MKVFTADPQTYTELMSLEYGHYFRACALSIECQTINIVLICEIADWTQRIISFTDLCTSISFCTSIGLVFALEHVVLYCCISSLVFSETKIKMFYCCVQFPSISSESLKNSGIGKAVMYLYKHPREMRDNRERAGKLISKQLKAKIQTRFLFIFHCLLQYFEPLCCPMSGC